MNIKNLIWTVKVMLIINIIGFSAAYVIVEYLIK